MEKILKIGIIGCGAIGKDHCRRIMDTVPGATVVAVSDYVPAAADAVAEKYGIRSFGNDCDGMIKDPEVEAVVITSIDPTHHDYVMKTLAEKKWCFCEKPLSLNGKDCEEIINKELEIGHRLVQVGFMRRYDRGYAEMKRIIESGELGAPLVIKACHRNVSQGPGFKTENAVTNVAIHELDICRWLLGDEYEDVQCVKVRQSSNSNKGYDNPQVMLMDEPLSNLDAKLRNQMRAEIIKLRQRINTTFIYVTHDQTEAMTLGDRIVIMKDGFIQQIGTPQEVFNHPYNLFVAGFIGTPQMNLFDAKLVKNNGKYAVQVGGITVELAEEKQAKLAKNNVAPQDVVLGVRPEHIELSQEGIDAKVDVSEMMGSTVHLHVTAMGRDVVLVVSTMNLTGAEVAALTAGAAVKFTFGGHVCHVFNKETGINLEA